MLRSPGRYLYIIACGIVERIVRNVRTAPPKAHVRRYDYRRYAGAGIPAGIKDVVDDALKVESAHADAGDALIKI